MSPTYEVRHISVSIDRSPQEVYLFVAEGENLPRWASGLGTSMRRDGSDWIAEGSIGRVRVHIAPANEFGVADQDVTLDTGVTVHNPIRIVANGTGSTVTFTLMRLPGVSEQRFDADAKWIEKDFATLKALLEKR